MIEVENIDIWGFKHAIRGMRNPLNSWERSDSVFEVNKEKLDIPRIGLNDLDLMRRLFGSGTEHRKYLRQIMVSMDITAPLYWWKEFDTYKVGTVANSCSTMHKITSKEFDFDDFSYEHLEDNAEECLAFTIGWLNYYRNKYLESIPHDKKYWWQLIQLLPSSYNQKRTVTMNYENVVSIISQRSSHKLDEWREFSQILQKLPYVEEIDTDIPREVGAVIGE